MATMAANNMAANNMAAKMLNTVMMVDTVREEAGVIVEAEETAVGEAEETAEGAIVAEEMEEATEQQCISSSTSISITDL